MPPCSALGPRRRLPREPRRWRRRTHTVNSRRDTTTDTFRRGWYDRGGPTADRSCRRWRRGARRGENRPPERQPFCRRRRRRTERLYYIQAAGPCLIGRRRRWINYFTILYAPTYNIRYRSSLSRRRRWRFSAAHPPPTHGYIII